MNHGIGLRIASLSVVATATFFVMAGASPAAPLPGVGTIMPGRFSLGLGAYQAPSGAESDSGCYALARYEISAFELEVDYGCSDRNFFLGAADYMYYLPTAEGITQTAIGFGAGVTFVTDDPGAGDTQIGANALGQIRFMDTFAAQIRYDFLGDKSNLWTFGLSYAFN